MLDQAITGIDVVLVFLRNLISDEAKKSAEWGGQHLISTTAQHGKKCTHVSCFHFPFVIHVRFTHTRVRIAQHIPQHGIGCHLHMEKLFIAMIYGHIQRRAAAGYFHASSVDHSAKH